MWINFHKRYSELRKCRLLRIIMQIIFHVLLYACIKWVTCVCVSKIWIFVLTTQNCISETASRWLIHIYAKCHKPDQWHKFSKQTSKDEKTHHYKTCMYMFINLEIQSSSLSDEILMHIDKHDIWLGLMLKCKAILQVRMEVKIAIVKMPFSCKVTIKYIFIIFPLWI